MEEHTMLQKKETPLALLFRGPREYILGADLLDATVQNLYGALNYPPVMDLTLLQKMSFAGLQFLPMEQATELQKAQAVALYTDAQHCLFLLPHGPKAEARVNDDEATVALAFSLLEEKREIQVPQTIKECSLARACVVAFKILLKQCHLCSGPFLFTRLKWTGVQPGPLTIRYQRLVGGLFWEGALLQENNIVGHIYFTKEGT